MTNILNLPRYNVLATKEDDHEYHLDAETASPSESCFACGSENVVGGGRQEILIKDLPMHGKRVGIYVKARRFRCWDCGKTPTECERLQGFPDGYTNIKPNGPDGPRYKALGNSMAVPVLRWIGARIQKEASK